VSSLFVSEILAFVRHFDFYSWSFVRRGGNMVAHTLVHWQHLCFEGRVWEVDVPYEILNRTSKDMYDFIGSNII